MESGSQGSADSDRTILEQDPCEILYFAYDETMSAAAMRRLCPRSTPVGLAYLPGFRWVVNERGRANAVPADDRGARIYGILYLVPPVDEDTLDEQQGATYIKTHADVMWIRTADGRDVDEGNGQVVRALVYVDERHVDEGRPNAEYARQLDEAITEAVGDWGLDGGYAESVMRRFWAAPEAF